jgi:glyceraldehyde-3-phosphate dehydrogenase/erythrose-4-phosphate dehydrogenase
MIVPVLYGMQFILYCMALSLFCITSNKTHFGSCSKENVTMYLGILFDKNTALKHKTVFVFFWFDQEIIYSNIL